MEDKNYASAGIPCTDIAKMSSDYSSCTIEYADSGIAIVTLVGASGGKFDEITCTGTKNNMNCTIGTPPAEWIYAFGDIEDASDGVKDYNDLNEKVFIRFNKHDLTEKYVCTAIDVESSGLAVLLARHFGIAILIVQVHTVTIRNQAQLSWDVMYIVMEALFVVKNHNGIITNMF